MKTISAFMILTLFLVGRSHANGLIFKSGFEEGALIGGSVSGLNEGVFGHDGIQLIVRFTPAGFSTINLTHNGDFVFSLYVEEGREYSVEPLRLPGNPTMQSCVINNASGVQTLQGVEDIEVICQDQEWNWDEFNWDEGGFQ